MFKKSKYYGALVVSLVLVFAFHTIKYSAHYIQANLIQGVAEEVLFDGTVMPLPVSVDWASLPDSFRGSNFNEVPDNFKQALPTYSASELARPFSDIDYKDPVRNAKITYSVVYMGNYELDGIEGNGSHAAVDIKALKGTPVVSVANGVVTKVRYLDSGFGNHVVVMHPNVPLEDGTVTTLYSSYSHLDKINVKEGEKILKGHNVGTIGATGFATTAHVHFQIDTEDAPFYPYWPFSGQEQRDAGLSFVEAVNAGLGQDNGYKYTVHPLNWVQRWANEKVEVPVRDEVDEKPSVNNTDATVSSDTAELIVARSGLTANSERDSLATLAHKPEQPTAVFVGTSTNENTDEFVTSGPKELISVDSFPASVEELKLKISVEPILVVDEVATLKLELLDMNNAPYPFGVRFSKDPLKISAGKLHFPEGSLKASNFVNGVSEVEFIPRRVGKFDFKVENGTFDVEIPDVEIREFADIELNNPALDVLADLKDRGIIEGYENGNFGASNKIVRAEVLKLILKANDLDLSSAEEKLSFSDIDSEMWFYDYMKAGYDLGIVEGDPDGKLRPLSNVTLGEYLKMLFTALEIDVAPADGNSEWYQPYLDLALAENLINQDQYLHPEKELTRMEVIELIGMLS